MSDPNPSLIPSDDDCARLFREQSIDMQSTAEGMRILATKMDRVRFAVEMCIAAIGVPHAQQIPSMTICSGNLIDTVQAMSTTPDGRTDMIHALCICLITTHRFADAAYRGYSSKADPMSDNDEPVGI